MKTTLLTIGKTDAAYLQTGIGDYVGRLGHYIPFEMVSLPDVKNVKNPRIFFWYIDFGMKGKKK